MTNDALRAAAIAVGWLMALPMITQAEDSTSALLLDEAPAIERFLEAVDGTPPDWASILGAMDHHTSERLFALNRERDRLREGRPALNQAVTFLWSGALSDYDSASGGFRVAIGPKHISTRWGLVRFKPDDLPSDLTLVPSPTERQWLAERMARGESIELDVAMTGRLIPEESIVYDHSHDDHTQGLIMPVVRIEKIEYRLAP